MGYFVYKFELHDFAPISFLRTIFDMVIKFGPISSCIFLCGRGLSLELPNYIQ